MEFKSAFIAVVGRPNAGKSTIINAIAGEKISIISKKPQTTRNKILAIVNEEDFQIVFVDTPGVHREKTKLGEYMNRVALGSISEVDAAVLVIDAQKGFGIPEEKICEELKREKIPTVLAINKVDAVKKEDVLPLIAKAGEFMEFDNIVPLSALHKDGVDILFGEIQKFLIEGPMYYPDDMITDRTEREIAAETIREKLLRLLDQEIPHGTAIDVFEMKDEENILRISANIYCEKKAHKAIIIGKGGQMLKKVGSYARADMEAFFGKKVFLTMWVKVKDGWRNDNFMLKSLGFTKEE
jgi:GTP-binding protein Era